MEGIQEVPFFEISDQGVANWDINPKQTNMHLIIKCDVLARQLSNKSLFSWFLPSNVILLVKVSVPVSGYNKCLVHNRTEEKTNFDKSF